MNLASIDFPLGMEPAAAADAAAADGAAESSVGGLPKASSAEDILPVKTTQHITANTLH